ncbi:tetratricopeptide repeat protein [Pseudoduganella flava]|uniref:Tetratricopeptide repeat protein n=1 Tax=Pseudoduganella flava TaxID=871742 RepID=A0A562PTU1_9BURK|nr:tetratricopeptide repeat protein [Pseudoduganella flava]QGZ38963.1 tetratricopeptide repeat protein [Pseudoduganella flava]TWI47773.1 tetratricopeptide repeat protein [Pseudoduganella flava]
MEPHRLSLPPLDEPGEVVTFYSHKGGAGRTMALANLAVMLARRNNATVPTLMIDWDMEAPGLHHYFRANQEGAGVLELFEACRDQLLRRSRLVGERDDEQLAQAVLDAVGWEQFIVRADQSRPLFLMRAGRQDASYAERLARLDWEGLFDACPALFRVFADNLARRFRHVLVDSRAGRTETAGICTTLLPTKLVLVFTPNRQHLDGLEGLVQRATTWRRSHEDEQRPLLIYPLPSRIEMDDSAQRALWRRGDPERGIPGYQPVFERALAEAYGLGRISLESYFDEVQLQQVRSLGCGEQLPVNADEEDDRFSITRTFQAFLGWFLGGYRPWQSREEIPLLNAVAQGRAAMERGGGRGVSLPLARDLALLGELYRREGRFDQAAACLDESLSLHVLILGDDHADTLDSKAALADLLFEQEKYEEAHFLQESVLEARERMFGAAATGTLNASSALAATLAQLGQVPEALALQDAVIDAHRRYLGNEHLVTVESLAMRADILCHGGHIDQAADLLEQVLALRARLLGTEHADTVRTRKVLAQAKSRMKQEPHAVHDTHQREHRIVSVEQPRTGYPAAASPRHGASGELAVENELSTPRIGMR